ncbi:hypothetical protein DIPPA_16057 [Diplonema papillatum]|nr:hypothetical protein DIPPA_16057 [Diplonema papillatum]
MASCVLVALLVLSAEPWEVGPDRCYKESDFLGGFMGLYWPDPVVSRENAPARVKRMLDWKISGQDRAADEIAGIFARHATDPDASEGAPPVLHLHGPSNHGKTASMMAIAAALCKAAPRVNGHRKPCSYLCRVGGRAGDADAGRVEAEVAAHLHQYPRGSILFDDVNEARGKQRMLALIERMVTRQPVYAAGGTPVSTEKAQIIFTSDYGFTDSPEDNTASDVLSHKREVKADEEAKFGSHRVASRTHVVRFRHFQGDVGAFFALFEHQLKNRVACPYSTRIAASSRQDLYRAIEDWVGLLGPSATPNDLVSDGFFARLGTFVKRNSVDVVELSYPQTAVNGLAGVTFSAKERKDGEL